jgi:hypothetical protein
LRQGSHSSYIYHRSLKLVCFLRDQATALDVSSMPQSNYGHTQMVAYSIGEGAAEMIKGDAQSSMSKLVLEVAKFAVWKMRFKF